MTTSKELIRQEQLDAIWKWRWLGWRKSTPAFKASMLVLGVVAVGLLVAAMR